MRPFANETPEVIFDAAALSQVVTSSQGYPYFLQLWGDALWQAKKDATRIGIPLVQAAERSVEASKLTYYEDRRDELDRLDVLPVAATVAEAFRGMGKLRSRDLEVAIVRALGSPNFSAAATPSPAPATSGSDRRPATLASRTFRALWSTSFRQAA